MTEEERELRDQVEEDLEEDLELAAERADVRGGAAEHPPLTPLKPPMKKGGTLGG